MNVARKLLVSSVALVCISLPGSSAQELIGAKRQFTKQSFFSVSPGSLYTRLQWRQAVSNIGRLRPSGPSFFGLETIRTPVAVNFPRAPADSQIIKPAPSPERAASTAKVSPKGKDFSQTKTPSKQKPPLIPRTLLIAALIGLIALALFLITRLFKILRPRENDFDAHDLSKGPPLDRMRQAVRSTRGASAEFREASDNLDAAPSRPGTSSESFPPQPAPISAGLTAENESQKSDSTAPERTGDIEARRDDFYNSGIGLSSQARVERRARPPFSETRDEPRLPEPKRGAPAPSEAPRPAASINDVPAPGAIPETASDKDQDRPEAVDPPLAEATVEAASSTVAGGGISPTPLDRADVVAITSDGDAVDVAEPAAQAAEPSPEIEIQNKDRTELREVPSELAKAVAAPVIEPTSPREAEARLDVETSTQRQNEERPVPALIVSADDTQAPIIDFDGVDASREATPDKEPTSTIEPSPDVAPEVETVAQSPSPAREETQPPRPREEERAARDGADVSSPSIAQAGLKSTSEKTGVRRHIPAPGGMAETLPEAPPASAPTVHEDLGGEIFPTPVVIPPAVPALTPAPPRAGVEKALQPATDRAPVPLASPSKPKPVRMPDAEAYARLAEKWKDELFGAILSRAGIDAPDGRPLYAYSFAPEDCAALEAFLSRRLRSAEALQSTGAAFVFWAAEHIRANFPRASERHLTWAFLFDAFSLPEDQVFARRLVGRGLKWWGRNVRKAVNGNQLYLYSLLVEGGLPEALLKQDGLYQRVVLGLLQDIETEGGARGGPAIAEPLAAGWATALPATFQGEDFIRLLAEFGLALAELRAAPPANLPPEKIRKWLDENRPNWAESLPLRASAETINGLIVPALQVERSERAQATPLVTREMRRDLTGCWRGFVRFAEQGWIPADLLPAGADLRLRLIPGGALMRREGAPSLFASPDRGGWRVRLFGNSRTAFAPLELFAPVRFAAFADAHHKGEIELDAGLPETGDEISLWRPAEGQDDAHTDALTLSSGSRINAACLWALAPADIRPTASDGLSVEGPEPADGGMLWRFRGKGEARFGDTCFSIETSADKDAPETRLVAFGDTLSDWKIERSMGLVFLGRPRLWGQKGFEDLCRIDERNLAFRATRGRTLAQHVAEWVENGVTLRRLRYVSLPETTLISLRETAPGEARLIIKGLQAKALQAMVRAGATSARATLSSGACEIELKTVGAAPGEVNLRLLDQATGATLDLVAPWPARSGMMFDADGSRLDPRSTRRR